MKILVENIMRIYKPVFVWALMFAYLCLMGSNEDTLVAELVSITTFEMEVLFIYYVFRKAIFPKYWYSKRIIAIVWIFILMILFLLLDNCVSYLIMPFFRGYDIVFYPPPKKYIVSLITYFSFTCVFALSNYLSANNIQVIKEQNKREQDLLRKELNFFKQQLNPEIIFDFLDYCYQNTGNKEKKASEAIVFFSNLLHYTFEKKPEEKVRLTDEINYINDFINLQKLLSSKVYVNFNQPGNIQDITILPRILITFIENAFKHGQFNDPLHPILINMDVNKHQFLFSVSNKIGLHKKKTSSGTGLNNVKQILELFYQNNYELRIEEQNGTYHCELKLQVT